MAFSFVLICLYPCLMAGAPRDFSEFVYVTTFYTLDHKTHFFNFCCPSTSETLVPNTIRNIEQYGAFGVAATTQGSRL
jgi:hypothetical protein